MEVGLVAYINICADIRERHKYKIANFLPANFLQRAEVLVKVLLRSSNCALVQLLAFGAIVQNLCEKKLYQS